MSEENNQGFFNSGNLLSFIFSRWKPLLIITLLALIGSIIISLVLPEKFKATVTLFPSQNNNLSRSFLSFQSDDTKDFLAFGEDNNAEQLLQVLKSDALMYAIEKKFNLIQYYSLQDKWDKYYLFKGYYNDLFEYNITQYESVEITVYDRNPHMAADMANETAHLADSIIRQIIRERAVAAYKIVKAQYDSAVSVARVLGDSLNFYHSLGLLQLPYQVKGLTSGYADALVKGNAEAAKTLAAQLKTFEQYGTGFLRVTNELEASYEWFKQARASYMEAKVNAEQTIPSFFIADKAIAPDRKTFPIRGLVVAGGTLAALLFSILIFLLLNRIETIKKKVKMEPRFESLSFLYWIARRIKPLLVIQVIALCLSIIFSSAYFMPKEYKSYAIVYPSNLSDYSHESPSEQLIEFFNSVDIKNEVISKFNLSKHFGFPQNGKPYLSKLYHKYDDNVSVKPTEFGAVELTVYDIDPDTAYEMAAYIIESLNKKVLNVHKQQFVEVADMWYRQLILKQHQIDSMTIRSKILSEQYGLLEYGNQTKEISRAYYQALTGGKGSGQLTEIEQQLKNLQEHGIEFRETNQHIDEAVTDYNTLESKYEDALKDVNKQLTYCNLVSTPYKPDSYTYPLRMLIILCTCLGALFFSIIFLKGAEKLKPARAKDSEGQ